LGLKNLLQISKTGVYLRMNRLAVRASRHTTKESEMAVKKPAAKKPAPKAATRKAAPAKKAAKKK
jgi:hypothetical protein